MRLQKYLSEQNLASRRQAEAYIRDGYVWINGQQVTQMGVQVDPTVDKIELKLPQTQQTTTLKFHKPRGFVSNCPQPGEKQITDLLPPQLQHLHTIGRLDKDSEGLILLTDDGVLAKHILNAERPHIREYLVWIKGELTESMIERLESGVLLFGEPTRPVSIEKYDSNYFKMTLWEGKNRQIRRMMLKVGVWVLRLKRIVFGPIRLDDLPKGQYEILSPEQIAALKES